ncbi:hypothetical protein RFI_38907 [Reticulomyxa filosa]|uniref:Uncharacterized protein n=1 Tax=Reticulomyxa filosa TaxID=46433 RepID=X6LB34_RETFI|nr:hypothetical protein RFI_38907 [Reticulomyxa filosa]|eukprot:ETN98585.1 hypothetical protein RFI_38907 [Reticulomyxa filosa]
MEKIDSLYIVPFTYGGFFCNLLYNPYPKMTKDYVDKFIDQVKFNFKLRKNTSKYDGIIIYLWTWRKWKYIGEVMKNLYQLTKCVCHLIAIKWMHLKIFRIFIIDVYCGENAPKSYELAMRGNEILHEHNDDGFLMQMLQDIKTEIRKNKSSEWYCMESQDTSDYDIIFQQRKSM